MKTTQNMTVKRLYWSRRKTLRTLSLWGGLTGGLLATGCMRSPLLNPETAISPRETPSPDADPLQTNELAAAAVSFSNLPDPVAAVLQNDADPNAAFTALMPTIVETLQCDRCFLFIRDPQRQRTRITDGYSREARWPTMVQTGWSREPSNLNSKDPLTLSAYQSPEAKFIDDIATAPPGSLDIQLERSVFGHRALIHAPIYNDGEFYGILEPCVFDVPRRWTESDRDLIQNLQRVLGSWIVRYLQAIP